MIRAVSVILILIACDAHALGPRRLSPSERAQCARLESNGFKVRQIKLPPVTELRPETRQTYSKLLNVRFNIVNHFRWNEGFFTSGDLRDALAQAREVFHGCGIEVWAETVTYWEAPQFINAADQDPDHDNVVSERERCLLKGAHHRSDIVNVYYVEESRSAFSVSQSHAIFPASQSVDPSFYGAALVTDDARGFSLQRRIVSAHEIAHIVLNEGHRYDMRPNLMQENLELSGLFLDAEQCAKARSSRYVRDF